MQVPPELWLPEDQQALIGSVSQTERVMAAAIQQVEELLVTHRSELLAFVERRIAGGAEDLVQQVAVRALSAAEELRDPGAGRAWLFQITRHMMVDHFRHAYPTSEPPGDLTADVEVEGFACACALANLDRLKPEPALMLRRVALDGVPIVALAKELGISENAANVRLHRARIALKEQLAKHCGTTSLRECLDCACVERGCCEGAKDLVVVQI